MKKLVLLITLIPSILHGECIVDGIRAEYIEVPDTRLQGQVAQAYIVHGKYIIEFSSKLNTLQPILKEHVLAHECAHHKLKHTFLPKSYSSDIYEFEADCNAVKQLKWDAIMVNSLIKIWEDIYPKEYSALRSEALKKCMYQN